MTKAVIFSKEDIFATGLKTILKGNYHDEIAIEPLENLFGTISNLDRVILFVDLNKLDSYSLEILKIKKGANIIINWQDNPKWNLIQYCLDNNIKHFCSQTTNQQEIKSLLKAIEENEFYFGKQELGEEIIRKIRLRLDNEININLSDREKEILNVYSKCQSLKEVSQQLKLSYGYIKNKFGDFRNLFSVTSNEDLIDKAIKLDLI